jgi:hypothetical protein
MTLPITKKKTVKAWMVLDDTQETHDGLILWRTRREMFEEYGVNTPREWEENIGWKYTKCTITYTLTKKNKKIRV